MLTYCAEMYADSLRDFIKMNDYNKIIGLLIIIVALVVVLGVAVLNPFGSHESCHVEILSMDSLEVGGSLSLSLADSRNSPIPNQNVQVTIIGGSGDIVNKNVTTDSSGKAVFQLETLPAGEYHVTCNAGGDDKYFENSTSKKITINDVHDSTTQSSGLSDDGYSYYPQYGPAVDKYGVTREEAIARNMHYIPMTVDGEEVGGYTTYDPVARCYHT